jgi:hypothetical protein
MRLNLNCRSSETWQMVVDSSPDPIVVVDCWIVGKPDATRNAKTSAAAIVFVRDIDGAAKDRCQNHVELR